MSETADGAPELEGRYGCCWEHGCTRHQPMMIMHSDLTDRWFVVTRWKQRKGMPDGYFEAITKHCLSKSQSDMLNHLTHQKEPKQ